MKKLLAMILMLILVFSLAACGSGSGDEVPPAVDGDGESQENPLRVCLVINNLGDNSFNDSCNNGLLEAARDFGIEYDCRQVGDDGVINGAREAAQAGYDIVCLAYDSDRRAFLDAESMDYPNTIFFIYDNSDTEYVPNENVLSVIFSANESDFVCGAISAIQSTSKVTGWVGGQEIMVLYDFLIGWVEGVKYADPNATTAYSWIAGDSPWYDPAKGKELAKALYNNYKADIIHGVAGQSGDGVIEAILEIREAGDDTVWSVGVDCDQYAVFMENGKEEKAEVILTSSLKKVATPVYNLIKTVVEGGTPVLGNQVYGIAEGAAGCADNEFFYQVAKPEAAAIADQITADVRSGKLNVDSAYGLTIDELKKIFEATTINYELPNLA
ncbi:MAG: BMP family ABC transporter substrate-binding protein [Oscillospiraceae bacterium]|nr:BMP family ABC transporter substrate-binding protein [Oscillospiraceae bacterium]